MPWLSPQVSARDQAFGHLARRLLTITAGAGEGGLVEVVDL